MKGDGAPFCPKKCISFDKMDKRFENTRKRIIQFAIEFLSSHEENELYNQIICDELHISKHTLYHHYPNLSNLYDDLYNELAKKGNENQKKVKSLDDFILSILKFNEENSKLIQAVYKTNRLKMETASKDNFRKHMEQYKVVDKENKFELYQLAFLYAGISEIVFHWVINGCDLSVDEIKRIIQYHIDK